MTAFLMACHCSNLGSVRTLMADPRVDIHATATNDGATSLLLAARADTYGDQKVEIVRILLGMERPPPLFTVTARGVSALSGAAGMDNGWEVVQIIIDHYIQYDAVLDAKDIEKDVLRAWMFAVQCGQVQRY